VYIDFSYVSELFYPYASFPRLPNNSNECIFLIERGTINKIVDYYNEEFNRNIHPHLFRGLLNGYREIVALEKGLDKNLAQKDLDILLNQEPTDVNSRAYKFLMKVPKNRLLIYDKYHPYPVDV
jgi:hypothetical protein